MKDRDYSKYEGVIIDWVSKDNDITRAMITGCDFDIGLTIQEVDENDNPTDHYLTCFHGPSSVKGREVKDEYDLYKAAFESAIKMIDGGCYDMKVTIEIALAFKMAGGFNRSTAESCPYNQ